MQCDSGVAGCGVCLLRAGVAGKVASNRGRLERYERLREAMKADEGDSDSV